MRHVPPSALLRVPGNMTMAMMRDTSKAPMRAAPVSVMAVQDGNETSETANTPARALASAMSRRRPSTAATAT